MNKVVILVKPLLEFIPMGVYEIDYECDNCYVIEGMFHNKDRFIECSSLLLELF